MRIRIMTFHTPKNYGAVLQGYSLMSYLEKYTEDVKVIDFNTPHLRSLYRITPKISGIKSFIKSILLLPTYSAKRKKYIKFEEFIKEQFKLTKRFENSAMLYTEKWDAEIFVTGSDQVFNPGRQEDEQKAFYLDFVPSDKFKVSYAASFGKKVIPEGKKEQIGNFLKNFNAISVREHSGIEIVKQVSDRNAIEVLDPVFLNNKQFWLSLAKPYPLKAAHYLLYYRLLDSNISDNFVERLAREKKLDLIVITDTSIKIKTKSVLRDVGPQEFLFLFANANFIATNSFHGVVFSLVFEKQFIFCDPFKESNDRGVNLLSKAGIEKQAYFESYCIEDELNYMEINKKLELLKKNSFEFIDKAMESFKNYVFKKNNS